MRQLKSMIYSYEVQQAIKFVDDTVVFAEDMNAAEPYMVCDRTSNQAFMQYNNVCVSDDYVEVMREFLARVSSRINVIASIREDKDISLVPLTEADCIKGSQNADYTKQLIVVKPECMIPGARTSNFQLLYAQSGSGCIPGAKGTSIYCEEIYSRNKCVYDRPDIAGIIEPSKMPAWAIDILPDYPINKYRVVKTQPDTNRSKNGAR